MQQRLSIEEVARYPLPGMAYPTQFAFSADDRWITYLYSPEGTLTQQLYVFEPESGESQCIFDARGGEVTEESLSLDEKLRRERQRQMALGVTSFQWAENAEGDDQSQPLLIPLQGEIYVSSGLPKDYLHSSLQNHQLFRRLVSRDQANCIDAQLSPDGAWAAYVHTDELYVVPTAGGQPRQLTYGARGTGKTNGLAEYIAQEEMDRSHGFWWSPDSRSIAFTEVDDNHIPIYRIMHQGKAATDPGAQEDHRYPFAGMPNAHIRLGIVSIQGGEPIWMDLGEEQDIYLARVSWLPDGRLAVQVQNREQSRLDLLVFDPQTGQATSLLQETSQAWINLHNMFWPLKNPAREAQFIWASERTGFRHLYLLDRSGNLVCQVTQGDWVVDKIVQVDEENDLVYFLATLPDPTQSQLYSAPLTGGEPRRITQQAGTHEVVFDHACRTFIDIHSALDQPPTVTLRSLADGGLLKTIYQPQDARLDQLKDLAPKLVTLQNRCGTTLYGALYRPSAEFGPGPYPTIVTVYGGPSAQMVTDSWLRTVAMRAQLLRNLGFLVFCLDNRGSARRGLTFEAALKYDMGHPEVEDQEDGVRWLVEQGLADPERVGIYGWSYGGYMTLMCLARAPLTFKVGVAGAPCTSWDGYDTHYTERYMGTPQSNPAGYRSSSVLTHVANVTGKLMLVHGLIDENVHFRHTARLINALIEARIPYHLLVFPDERHSPRRQADRMFMEEQIRDFFLKYL